MPLSLQEQHENDVILIIKNGKIQMYKNSYNGDVEHKYFLGVIIDLICVQCIRKFGISLFEEGFKVDLYKSLMRLFTKHNLIDKLQLSEIEEIK